MATNSKVGARHLKLTTTELKKFWFRLEFAGLAIKCGIIPEYKTEQKHYGKG